MIVEAVAGWLVAASPSYPMPATCWPTPVPRPCLLAQRSRRGLEPSAHVRLPSRRDPRRAGERNRARRDGSWVVARISRAGGAGSIDAVPMLAVATSVSDSTSWPGGSSRTHSHNLNTRAALARGLGRPRLACGDDGRGGGPIFRMAAGGRGGQRRHLGAHSVGAFRLVTETVSVLMESAPSGSCSRISKTFARPRCRRHARPAPGRSPTASTRLQFTSSSTAPLTVPTSPASRRTGPREHRVTTSPCSPRLLPSRPRCVGANLLRNRKA